MATSSQGGLEGSKAGVGKPVDVSHPLIAKLAQVVTEMDPDRRSYLPRRQARASGARAADFGRGLHWDVHGPWKLPGTMAEWIEYWAGDALFRSETGAPGASSAEIIRRYRGDLAEMPGTAENPLWRRTSWWIEWPIFIQEQWREPASLEEFVAGARRARPKR